MGTITYHNYSSIFPIISSVNSAALYPPGFEVTWTTDVPSTSRVEYGLTDSYGSFSALYITPKNSHTVPISNLLPLTTYHYRIISVGNTGNSTTSGDYVFTIPSGGSGISVPLNQQEDIGTIKFEKGDTENNLPVSAKDIQELIEIPPVSESSINTTVTEQKIETATGGAEPFGTREKTIDIAIKFSGIEVTGLYICQNRFTDTPTPYSCEVAEKAQFAGLISQERTTFHPTRSVTRVEAYAIFMKSICVAPETNENNWQKLIIKKAIELGFTTRTIDTFRPNRTISTPEMFALAQKIGEWKKNNPDSCENK